jgi:hypothetical protein
LSSSSVSNGVALCTIDERLLVVFEQVCGSLGISFKVLRYNSNCILYVELDSLESDIRRVISVEKVETVPTQCIVVDSPTHTYLAGYSMIPTHNSNKEIKKEGFYDSAIRSE